MLYVYDVLFICIYDVSYCNDVVQLYYNVLLCNEL